MLRNALRWRSDNFSIAISADYTGPAAHYVLRASERQSVVACLSEALETDVSSEDLRAYTD